ncbi:MAG TPA: BamA/TamA family outer membrane protein, partial [Vicinamibacterales bacterium]|nr:BamA/TamA family outer membrane protein [Vicinamibacterales bacterium]
MRTTSLVLSMALLATTAPLARADDALDAGDLWRHLRHHAIATDEQTSLLAPNRPFFVVAPSIGSKPSTGINGGIAGNIAFVTGDPSSTRLSSISGGLKVSEKGQTLSGMKVAMFLPDDRWFVQGDNRFSLTSLDTYGLGDTTSSSDADNLKYNQLRLYETLYRTVAPGLFVGIGLDVNQHSNVRPGTGTEATFDQSAYALYTQQHGFDLLHQTSSGTTASLMFDTRDNAINAQRGWLLSATYRTFFDGFLGGDSSWQEAYFDIRTFRKLTSDGRRRLAFWVLGDFVTGGSVPYFDLPEISGDAYGRSARGYTEGRYRGDSLVYGEIEFRDTVTRNGLLGYVAFVNTTTISGGTSDTHLFESYAPAAGAGLRVLLNKKSRTNLCVDYG